MKSKMTKGIRELKKSLIFILPLVFHLFFGGCSNNEMASVSEKKKEPVTLKFAWWGEQPRHDSTKKVIELFEKENPDIHIEYEYSNWDEYWKRLAPMAATNQLPDILQMDLLYLKSYSQNNLLEDLTPYIKGNLINTNSIDEQILTGGKVGNKLFGFPLGLNAPVVIMDHQLISQAGVSIPQKDWNWDKFEKIASEIHKESNIYGTEGMKPPDVFFSYYLTSKGKSLYNADGTSLGYEDDALFVDYFDMQLRLLDQGALPKVDVTEQINRIEDQLFVNQKAAITWAYSNQYYSFSNVAKRSLELLPPPSETDLQARGLTIKPSMLFSISKGSKHKKEAARFINFFVNNIEANKLIKGERGVPISSKVASAVKMGLPEEQKKVFDYFINVENKEIVSAYPLGAAEVVKTLQDISNQILFKKITPVEGAKRFRDEANKILSQNKKG